MNVLDRLIDQLQGQLLALSRSHLKLIIMFSMLLGHCQGLWNSITITLWPGVRLNILLVICTPRWPSIYAVITTPPTCPDFYLMWSAEGNSCDSHPTEEGWSYVERPVVMMDLGDWDRCIITRFKDWSAAVGVPAGRAHIRPNWGGKSCLRSCSSLIF